MHRLKFTLSFIRVVNSFFRTLGVRLLASRLVMFWLIGRFESQAPLLLYWQLLLLALPSFYLPTAFLSILLPSFSLFLTPLSSHLLPSSSASPFDTLRRSTRTLPSGSGSGP